MFQQQVRLPVLPLAPVLLLAPARVRVLLHQPVQAHQQALLLLVQQQMEYQLSKLLYFMGYLIMKQIFLFQLQQQILLLNVYGKRILWDCNGGVVD